MNKKTHSSDKRDEKSNIHNFTRVPRFLFQPSPRNIWRRRELRRRGIPAAKPQSALPGCQKQPHSISIAPRLNSAKAARVSPGQRGASSSSSSRGRMQRHRDAGSRSPPPPSDSVRGGGDTHNPPDVSPQVNYRRPVNRKRIHPSGAQLNSIHPSMHPSAERR